MECRSGCGACCIAPSITSPIPGMLEGKPAGVVCINLTEDFRCRIFADTQRPAVCASFKPTEDICGENREQAMATLHSLENLTGKF